MDVFEGCFAAENSSRQLFMGRWGRLLRSAIVRLWGMVEEKEAWAVQM